jgi:hypothetical protein
MREHILLRALLFSKQKQSVILFKASRERREEETVHAFSERFCNRYTPFQSAVTKSTSLTRLFNERYTLHAFSTGGY